MFATLKNKIREEIGNDVSAVVRNAGNVRGINSRHMSQTGSTSSISGSQISLDGSREENAASPSPPISLRKDNSFDLKLNDGMQLSAKDIKRLESREDEWRRRLAKKEAEMLKRMEKKEEEWKVRLFEKEKEWKKVVEKQEKEKSKVEEELKNVESTKLSLELALKDAEEYKKKLYSFQEDAEQLEGFQTQEMAKIKHLLLAKEQEVDEKTHNLKAANAEIESLKSEVSRLRRYEDELNSVQDEMETLRHSTQRERAQLSCQLAQTEEEVRHLKDKVFLLEQRIALESNDQVTVDERIADLMRERALLERKLEEAHLHLSDIKTSWSGKISSLETQVGRLSRQAGEEGLERRRVEEENERLKQRIKQLEAEIEESSSKEIAQLKQDLEDATTKLSSATSELAQVRLSVEGERTSNSSLHLEVARLREDLETERTASATLKVYLEKERNEKDTALIRNAQVSQDIEIVKQENRRQEIENIELQNRIDALERSLESKNKEVEQAVATLEETKQRTMELEEVEQNRKKMERSEKQLKSSLMDLEEQLNEKTKTIKVLQQRLADMKKTLQRELRVPSASLDSDAEPSAAILKPSSSKTVTARQNNTREEDVNFKYLKHVLIKFLTSREYEALHLTRAVATLLHFSPEEERLLQETLEWKMSWFGTRPNLGFGQTAKAIPPS
ncbi:golgin subfamily A member 1-like isoform X3 [Ceratina calcarata]|uniref:Golgin subfamily A member 1-like isoform X3 n=1 Tax=Ceratina calcarata TaxID=156304 RepID=A0AAJ7J7W5_9HYME|nr:golgin subfamily A member 1-like isoform X3 [Ceratina calcarata]